MEVHCLRYSAEGRKEQVLKASYEKPLVVEGLCHFIDMSWRQMAITWGVAELSWFVRVAHKTLLFQAFSSAGISTQVGGEVCPCWRGLVVRL